MQKTPLIKEVGRLMFKGYQWRPGRVAIIWSTICADVILVSGIVYLIFF